MQKIPLAILALALSAALGACNRADPDATAVTEPATTTTEPAVADEPEVASVGTLVVYGTDDGAYLTDNAGRALYVLDGDDTGTRCVDDCLQAWPLVGGAAPASGVPEVEGALIGTTTRADGTVQITYNGHPLYYFAEEEGTGTTSGRDVTDKWGHWTLLRPNGELLEADMAVAGAAPASDMAEEPAPSTQPASNEAPPSEDKPASDDGY